jgi:hypothetical protein
VLGSKNGDQQSRAELLGRLLIAVGDKPYMLQHGTERECRNLILLRMADDEVAALCAATGKDPVMVKVGSAGFIPLPLEADMAPGQIPQQLYDAGQQRWNGTVAVMRYK